MADDDNLLQPIETLRDRIRLQLHLASMDARDEYERLEQRFRELASRVEARRDNVSETVSGAAQTVDDTAKKVVDDLRDGYEKLAAQLGSAS